MEFRIGDIAARCPSCGAREFEFIDGKSGRDASRFRCLGCSATTTYSTLLDAVTAEVARRAAELLRNLRKPK